MSCKKSLTRLLGWNSKIPSMPLKVSYWGTPKTNLSQFSPGVWAVGSSAIDFGPSTSCNSGTSVDAAGCRSLDLKQEIKLISSLMTFLRNPVHFFFKKTLPMMRIGCENLKKKDNMVNFGEWIHQPVNESLSLNRIIRAVNFTRTKPIQNLFLMVLIVEL